MTELWEEYLIRHGLPVVKPFEPFVEEISFQTYIPENPPIEHRMWIFFLMSNSQLISNYQLENLYNFYISQEDIIPSISEQQSVLFRKIPYLEVLWNNWQSGLSRYNLIFHRVIH